jgi:F420-non-reducing hydrogenase large subunit
VTKKVNLIVATTNNHAAISMSIKKAAFGLIKAGQAVSDEILNMIEMAFRAYDPCFGCATHSLPGEMPMEIKIYDHNRKLVNIIRRD